MKFSLNKLSMEIGSVVENSGGYFPRKGSQIHSVISPMRERKDSVSNTLQLTRMSENKLHLNENDLRILKKIEHKNNLRKKKTSNVFL